MKIIDKLITSQEINTLSNWVPSYFKFGGWETCFYCGEFPSDIDHVIPYSFLWSYDRGRDEAAGIRTPACSSCNGRLGSFFFDTLYERCSYIRGLSEDHAARLLKLPNWCHYEINQLDHSLGHFVKGKQERKKVDIRRAQWQATESFQTLFERAFHKAKSEFPSNKSLHCFMRPAWL